MGCDHIAFFGSQGTLPYLIQLEVIWVLSCPSCLRLRVQQAQRRSGNCYPWMAVRSATTPVPSRPNLKVRCSPQPRLRTRLQTRLLRHRFPAGFWVLSASPGTSSPAAAVSSRTLIDGCSGDPAWFVSFSSISTGRLRVLAHPLLPSAGPFVRVYRSPHIQPGIPRYLPVGEQAASRPPL